MDCLWFPLPRPYIKKLASSFTDNKLIVRIFSVDRYFRRKDGEKGQGFDR